MERDDVDIWVGEGYIRGTFVCPDSVAYAPGILMLHGWNPESNRASYVERAQHFARQGVVCLAIDFPGHGESTDWKRDEVSRGRALFAAIAAYDFLVKTGLVDANRIGGFGRSFGAYVLAILSGLRHFRWLHLGVPASYPDDGFWIPQNSLDKSKTRAYRNRQVLPGEDLAFGAIAQFTGPVNIVSSGQDDRIPERAIQNFVDAAGPRVQHLRIKEASHHGATPEQEGQAMTFIMNSWRNCFDQS